MSSTENDSSGDAVSAIARYGLDSASLEVVEPGAETADFLASVSINRIGGVAVRAFEEGALMLEDEAAAELIAEHDAAMARTLRVEVALLRVADALAAAAISYRVLKGSALAHTVASDPADREFRDVDLLVAAGSLHNAVSIVESMGGRRLQPELRSGFDERFGKSVTMTLDGVEIDLHRTLAPGPFGVWMHPGDLFVLAAGFELAGSNLPTLDPTDHLVHACYHVALGQAEPALTNLRDIVLLLERSNWDAERFAETVARWQGSAAIARAIDLVSMRLGVRLPPALTGYAPQPGDSDLLAPYLVKGDRFPGLAKATLWVLPPSERVAFARAVGFPSGVPSVERARELLKASRWRNR